MRTKNVVVVVAAWLIGVAGVTSGLAQEEKVDSTAVAVAKSAGIGALLGAVLGGNAAAGAAISAGASVALKEPGNVAGTAGATDLKAPEVHREGDEASGLDAEVIAAIGSSDWDAYKAMRGCDYASAADHATRAAKSDSEHHQLASQWLLAMIAVDRSQDAAAESALEELVAADSDIHSTTQAKETAANLVLQMRSERIDLEIGPCDQ